MSKRILITSNKGRLSSHIVEELRRIAILAVNSNNEVIIFKEDFRLYDAFRDVEGVECVSSICGSADKLLFGKKYFDFYDPGDAIKEITLNYKEITSKALSRYKAPSRDAVYDMLEYNSRRESVMWNRIKFAMSKITEDFPIVVQVIGKHEDELIKPTKPEFGDGKFIYTIDLATGMSNFFVGGATVPAHNFEVVCKGV